MEDTQLLDQELAAIEEFGQKRRTMRAEIRKVIVGQDKVIEEVLIALFSKGHCLLVGVPGLAKTMLISTLAEVLDLDFNRIQFTPDLMPSDITGTDILQEDATTGRRQFQFLKGPIFTNVLLADEINRTPPKTQAALLQSMQEYRVTASGTTYLLDLPFFVLATQNPIEQEGTYPLPEAQLDRFMLNIEVSYPPLEDEVQIVLQTTSTDKPSPAKVMDGPGHSRLPGPGAAGAGFTLRGELRRVPGPGHPSQQPLGARGGEELRRVGSGSAGVAVPGAGKQGQGPSWTGASRCRWKTCKPWRPR